MQDFEAFLKDLKEMVIVKKDPDLGQPYDLAIVPSIGKLKTEIQNQHLEQQKITIKRQQAVADGLPQELIENLDEFSGDCVDNQILLEQQMAVIAEMRLVYLYKSFEIELKKLLKSAYNAPARSLSSADDQIAFLKTKGINARRIAGFAEINELRTIVNNIKHGTELNSKAKRIPEFANSVQVIFDQGTTFYKRVAPMVNKHIEVLSEQVFKTLYPGS
ncbi:hypothetical protein IDJ77_04070 [Mucilaginibacter sp. ZT4R22]|uniref:Uncharacterized protein n=1 Tax=Mucilaginibacter pankratovii TaxID=2772110 RepID=A0ABR7WKY2_9SPHI|nr:hypothetical protein [Mucilaginibacter pankratovii]MBD1362978.1 hypothetical protein [Mucilaginibacter pankratovii]